MEVTRYSYHTLKGFADIYINYFRSNPKEPPPDPCAGDVFNWAASDPGFTDEIYQVRYQEVSMVANCTDR